MDYETINEHTCTVVYIWWSLILSFLKCHDFRDVFIHSQLSEIKAFIPTFKVSLSLKII